MAEVCEPAWRDVRGRPERRRTTTVIRDLADYAPELQQPAGVVGGHERAIAQQ